jgi:glutamate decarboxylase
LFSKDLRKKMAGIERADSVTIDGHKQLFVPMGSGVLVLKNPEQCRFVAKTASYIIRKGSMDAGRFTLEGSRPGNVIYMHANMKCIGSEGFELIVNRTARICKHMADTLEATGLFDVVFEPMMNILLYRYVPERLRHKVFGGASLDEKDCEELDAANVWLQEKQKYEGRTFVSRTTIFDPRHKRHMVSLRVVIGNPVTKESDIDAVISDQLQIIQSRR